MLENEDLVLGLVLLNWAYPVHILSDVTQEALQFPRSMPPTCHSSLEGSAL